MRFVAVAISIILLSTLAVAISDAHPFIKNQPKKSLSYLALGDSYTIGESVKNAEQWPRQLADVLSAKDISIDSTSIIAKTGWRTDDLLKAAKENLQQQTSDLVSLLIGVNNEFQGWSPEKFEPEFEKCLKYAIEHCENGRKGVFVLSIPDYGYTPFGKKRQKGISKRIDQYNAICKRISAEYQVAFFDITPISRQGLKDATLVATDGLHPSAKQYALWVKEIEEGVIEMIEGLK